MAKSVQHPSDPSRRRRQQQPQPVSLRQQCLGLLMLFLSGTYILALWKAQVILDSIERQSSIVAPEQGGGQILSQSSTTDPEALVEQQSGIQPPMPQVRNSKMEERSSRSITTRDVNQSDKEKKKKKHSEETDTPLFRRLSEKLGNKTRILLFDGHLSNQGAGNVMLGLLASHLFGLEFDRVVCVRSFPTFFQAFHPIDPIAVELCPKVHTILQQEQEIPANARLSILSYFRTTDECWLKKQLSSRENVLVRVFGNSYPRWPTTTAKSLENLFLRFYEPTEALRQVLPWNEPPPVVVHLRDADNPMRDARKGLDESAFKALGKMLPRNTTFLVTNRVAWYKYFGENFGWRHPPWFQVVHSTLNNTWGTNISDPFPKARSFEPISKETNTTMQNLQLWADWFTIARAQKVYHTHSDFSNSALMWQQTMDTHTIGDYNETSETIDLIQEHWRPVQSTPRLVDRNATELKGCTNRFLHIPSHSPISDAVRRTFRLGN